MTLEPDKMEDIITLSEEESFINLYSERYDNLINHGKKIVMIIIVLFAVGTIIDFLCNIASGGSLFNTALTLVLRIIVIITLLSGRTWARYLYCGFSFITVVTGLYTLLFYLPQVNITNSMSIQQKILFIILPTIIDMAYNIFSSMILISHRAVKEYL